MAARRPRRETALPPARPAAHLSAAIPLALLFAALIVYASLSPFTGWRWPAQLSWSELLILPLPPWRDRFDIVANLVGYLPLGLLAYLAGVRSQGRPLRVWLAAVAGASLLSYAMELAQQCLPGRFPSALDWGLNSAGGLLGATLGALLQFTRLIDRWQATRDRWFWRRSRGALVLLLLWPAGLLFPAPLPLGLGPSWARLREALVEDLLDVTWAEDLLALVLEVPVPEQRLPLGVEALGTALGLLAPCLLVYSVTRPGWRRAVLAAAAVFAGLLATLLSAAMNFGPVHALAWVTVGVAPALGLGGLLALLLWPVPQRLAAALGIVALSAQMAIVLQAPSDPYFALSLQAWEQGRFIRFHGLAQWIGWIWPLAAVAWLAARLASAERMPPLTPR